jgi:hypothetical protein
MLRSFMAKHSYFSKCPEVLWRGISIFPNAQKFYGGALLFFQMPRSFMAKHSYFSKCLEVLWRSIAVFPNA